MMYIHHMVRTQLYLDEAIQLLPHAARARVRPSEKLLDCSDLRCLLALIFDYENPRVQYEALRKLYLAKLLIDIEHSRHIQDGPKHKNYFEGILLKSLWQHTRQVNELEIGFRISDDGQSVQYSSRPTDGDQRWTFRSIFLEKWEGDRNIALDILYHNCRFKRTVDPISFEIVDGRHQVIERVRWGQMRRHRSRF